MVSGVEGTLGMWRVLYRSMPHLCLRSEDTGKRQHACVCNVEMTSSRTTILGTLLFLSRATLTGPMEGQAGVGLRMGREELGLSSYAPSRKRARVAN